MTQFTAYGLSIGSEFALSELPTTERAPDVCIRHGDVSWPELDLDETGHGFAQSDDGGWVYHFDQAGTFRIHDGRAAGGAQPRTYRGDASGSKNDVTVLDRAV